MASMQGPESSDDHHRLPPANVSNSRVGPYLTLPHHISLAWLATPIISLIFVAFRLLISSSDTQDSADEAKQTLLSSCRAAQRSAAVAVNIPMFLAEGTNRMIEKSVNESIEVARDTMIFSLVALQGIIEFVIDIYRSVLLCFIELVVFGSLAVVIGAVSAISSFLTDFLNTARTNIQSDIQKANDAIASVINAFNGIIPSFLNLHLTPPTIDIPSLGGLQNVQLPTTVQDALTNLNNSIPTVDDIRQTLDAVIAIPFTNLKNEINGTFTNLRFTASALPVPQEHEFTFCDSLDVSIVDDLAHDILKIAKTGCWILLGCALLLVIGNILIQWYRWRVLRNRMRDVRDGRGGDPALARAPPAIPGAMPTMELSDRNLLTLFTSMQHPFSTSIAQRISNLFRLSPQKQSNVRFFFAYIFYPSALACLLIGLFGIITVEIQLAVLGPLRRHYTAVVHDSINDFSQTIADQVNSTMVTQSASYAASINEHVQNLQTSVNGGVFGWVNGTVVPLNNTIAAFYNDIQNGVEKVFGNTVLDNAAHEFIRCLIGSKVQNIENALTFVQENFQVKVPQVDLGVLVLSDASVKKATDSLAQAAVGGDGENDGVVARLMDRYVASLKKERVMYIVFLALWGVTIVLAFLFIVWSSYGAPLLFAWRKRKYDRAVQAHKVGEGVVVPWALPREVSGDDRVLTSPVVNSYSRGQREEGGRHQTFNEKAFPQQPRSPPPPPLPRRRPRDPFSDALSSPTSPVSPDAYGDPSEESTAASHGLDVGVGRRPSRRRY